MEKKKETKEKEVWELGKDEVRTIIEEEKGLGKGGRRRRNLGDLNLVDNFLFGAVVSHPKIGEVFIRALVRILLQREFKKLQVIPQRVYFGKEPRDHGIQLDLYLEAEEAEGSAAVYDIEPDKNRKDVKALPFRIRFYHSKIDNGCLASGEGYENLKRVTIVMILTYDPFGQDRMLYTIQSGCVEEPDMPYDDRAKTLLFYTKGSRGIPSGEIRDFLRYMEHSTLENATDKTLREIHEMVETVKKDREVTTAYMRWPVIDEEEMEEIREQALESGWKRGMERGMAQGMAQGMERGMAQGMERGMAQGELKGLIRIVCHNLKRGVPVSEIADMLGEPQENIERISRIASKAAPDYDADRIADQLLKERV